MLHFQRYDIKLHCVKGMKMFVTDTLSRAALQDDDSEISADTSLTALAKQVKNGWPDHRDDIDHSIRPYFNFRHELKKQRNDP